MKRRTGSKLGKEYVKAIYCHPAYLKSRHNKLKMCLKGQAKPNAWMFGQNRAGFLAEGGWAWQNVWEVRGLIWKTSPLWLLHLLETVRPDLPTTPSKFFRSPAQWVFLHLLNHAHSITNTKQVALSFPQAHLQPHFHVSLLTLSSWEPLLTKPPSLHGKQTSLSPRTEQPHPTSTEILIPGCPADQTQNMSMNLPVPQTHIILSTPVLGFSSGRSSILTTDWSPCLNLPLLYSVLQRLPAYHSLKIKKGFITQKNHCSESSKGPFDLQTKPAPSPSRSFSPGFSTWFLDSVVAQSSLTLQLHGLRQARLPCPSPSPAACSNSCPLSQWCHPTISSSVIPFSCPQCFPASGSYLMSQLFASGGPSIGVPASASILPINIQVWFPLGLTGLILDSM